MNIRAQIDASFRPSAGHPPVEWLSAEGLRDYPSALAFMEDRVRAINEGTAGELVWLVEHPPLYTAGTSASPGDLVLPDRFPVFEAGRGGQYTYHGPGQRVAYLMLDLKHRRQDVRAFVAALEEWIIRSLARLGVHGERRPEGVGIWVPGDAAGRPARKIAAIGIRLRRWVSFHGIAVNIAPDLSHFDGIVPCGIRGAGVTSLADLGRATTMAEFDLLLREAFEEVFGPTADAAETTGKEATR